MKLLATKRNKKGFIIRTPLFAICTPLFSTYTSLSSLNKNRLIKILYFSNIKYLLNVNNNKINNKIKIYKN